VSIYTYKRYGCFLLLHLADLGEIFRPATNIRHLARTACAEDDLDRILVCYGFGTHVSYDENQNSIMPTATHMIGRLERSAGVGQKVLIALPETVLRAKLSKSRNSTRRSGC
jgi:hypothetical protein